MPIFEDCGYEIADQSMFDAVSYVRVKLEVRKELDKVLGARKTKRDKDREFYYEVAKASDKYGALPKYGEDSIADHLQKISVAVRHQRAQPIKISQQLTEPLDQTHYQLEERIDLTKDIMTIDFNDRNNEPCVLQHKIVSQLSKDHPFLATVMEHSRLQSINVVQITIPKSMAIFKDAIESTFDQFVKADGIKFALEFDK